MKHLLPISWGDFKVDRIKPYKSASPKDSDGQAVSSNIVPIIYKKDLDDIANEFLAEYYPEALVKPVPVPIADIAEKMGLTILGSSGVPVGKIRGRNAR